MFYFFGLISLILIVFDELILSIERNNFIFQIKISDKPNFILSKFDKFKDVISNGEKVQNLACISIDDYENVYMEINRSDIKLPNMFFIYLYVFCKDGMWVFEGYFFNNETFIIKRIIK